MDMRDDQRTQLRTCFVSFNEHMQNAFTPNMCWPELPNRWSDDDWFAFVDMILDLGFNSFSFKILPLLFCQEGMRSDAGEQFARQMQAVIDYATGRGLGVKMRCALTTVGKDWHTHCPNVREEWDECRMLWDEWTRRLTGLEVVGIFPGDPGGCSRNGCTALTYIDKALEIVEIVKKNQPGAEIELGTWGNPFFGWGTIEGPPGWQGEFFPGMGRSAWRFDKARADDAMGYLLRRLPDFPFDTSVAINMGFNPDSGPDAGDGEQDARPWAREIARTHRILTWDYSLTEGENAVIPHYRFKRLFEQRRRERDAAPYTGGICYTMTPMLNQLSLFVAAQSFLNPDADPDELAGVFCERLFGPEGRRLVPLLPLFEVIRDWGNYVEIDLSRADYHRRMQELVDLLHALKDQVRNDVPFHPSPEIYCQELLLFAELFRDLSGPTPDFDALRQRYWQKVYSITSVPILVEQ